MSLDKNVYRVLEVKGEISLYKFAETITKVFDFYFDHCFGFFSNTKGNIFDSSEVYELFTDLKDCESTPGAKGVKKEYVYDVFKSGKKMTFYFDYGDDWHFLTECLAVSEPVQGKKYPQLLESKGPVEQYPSYDEEDDFNDEDFDEEEVVKF